MLLNDRDLKLPGQLPKVLLQCGGMFLLWHSMSDKLSCEAENFEELPSITLTKSDSHLFLHPAGPVLTVTAIN